MRNGTYESPQDLARRLNDAARRATHMRENAPRPPSFVPPHALPSPFLPGLTGGVPHVQPKP